LTQTLFANLYTLHSTHTFSERSMALPTLTLLLTRSPLSIFRRTHILPISTPLDISALTLACLHILTHSRQISYALHTLLRIPVMTTIPPLLLISIPQLISVPSFTIILLALTSLATLTPHLPNKTSPLTLFSSLLHLYPNIIRSLIYSYLQSQPPSLRPRSCSLEGRRILLLPLAHRCLGIRLHWLGPRDFRDQWRGVCVRRNRRFRSEHDAAPAGSKQKMLDALGRQSLHQGGQLLGIQVRASEGGCRGCRTEGGGNADGSKVECV
jgi:hypothetical protein